MLVEDNKEELKYLKKLGFKVKHFDDKSGWWLELPFKSKPLKRKVLMAIEDFQGDGMITASTYGEDDMLFDLVSEGYTRDRLKEILQFLTGKKI